MSGADAQPRHPDSVFRFVQASGGWRAAVFAPPRPAFWLSAGDGPVTSVGYGMVRVTIFEGPLSTPEESTLFTS